MKSSLQKQTSISILYVPEEIPDEFDAMCEAYQRNFERLRTCDAEAQKNGGMVGRYFREMVFEGYAYYVVSEDMGGWVRVVLAQGVGTDTPATGYGLEAVILKELAQSRIKHRHSPF